MTNDGNHPIGTINRILDFVNDGKESDLTRCLQQQCDAHGATARLVCLHLLGWLRGRGNLQSKSKLRFSSFPWCFAMQDCVQNCVELATIFSVDEHALDFCPGLDQHTVADIEKTVLDRYHPPLFITRQ